MHIVIGIISAVAGLLWALNSLQNSGFRFSSINPFYWHRRNKWKKQYAQNPLYLLDSPMDVAAVLLLGIAKLEGEISREHKSEILNIFSQEFNLDKDKATELFASTSFLLQSENNFIANIGKVLEPSKDNFSPEQAESTIKLLHRIASFESDISSIQSELLNSITKYFRVKSAPQGKW